MDKIIANKIGKNSETEWESQEVLKNTKKYL